MRKPKPKTTIKLGAAHGEGEVKTDALTHYSAFDRPLTTRTAQTEAAKALCRLHGIKERAS